MKDQPLIYQPDRNELIRTYRVAWYGGESTQLHFQRWCVIATPTFDGEHDWVDIDVRTLMELQPRVNDLYDTLRDHSHYGICLEQEYLESLMNI